MTSIHPQKLLLTKWTAVKPVAKQKHFLITKVVLPEILNGKFDQGAPDECAGQSLIGTTPSELVNFRSASTGSKRTGYGEP